MDVLSEERRAARLPFIIAGLALGTLANGFYLYRINVRGVSLFGMPARDPFLTQVVNVMLIYFACVLQMNLLGRGLRLLRRLKG